MGNNKADLDKVVKEIAGHLAWAQHPMYRDEAIERVGRAMLDYAKACGWTPPSETETKP